MLKGTDEGFLRLLVHARYCRLIETSALGCKDDISDLGRRSGL